MLLWIFDITVNIVNIGTPEMIAVSILKFEHEGC